VAEMEEIERAMSLNDGLSGAPALIANRRDLGQGPDLLARACRPADRGLWNQFCDA